ncbi:MAG: HpsJ family protein [Coleofasciculaceae cyanobacterium]
MKSQSDTPWSVAVFRKIGYGLLLLALFDLIATLFPPNFTNPLWQFETMGAIVERVAVPLIGLVLVFFGEEKFRSSLEQKLLKSLRWLCLLVGVLFFLLIPLGLVSAIQVKKINDIQISGQFKQQNSRIDRVEKQLNSIQDQDLENFIKSQGRSLDSQSPQQAREQFLEKIKKDKKQLQTQFEQAKATRRLTVLKNLVKWSLGALVSGILFIYIWLLTRLAL